MKSKSALIMLLGTIVLLSCGEEQPVEGAAVSPLDVLPEEALFSLALNDPSSIISSLDGYAAGVPVLGENAVSGLILSAMDCADMSEVESKLGIKTDGGIVVFMESMMPQSMGAALTVSDPDVFWANVGIVPQEAEELEGYQVTAIPVDFGSIYFCHTDGLLLAAGSRAGLQSMLDRMDGQLPDGLPEIPAGSFYLYTNVETFGPMMANQIAMFQPQIMAEMSTEENVDMDMMQGIIGMYFDAINLFLNGTKSYSCVVTLDREFIRGRSNIEFIPGSVLDTYVVPAEIQDLTGSIPVGDIMVGRVNIDPVMSEAVMNGIFSSMGIAEIPQEMIQFWAQTTKNTAMSMNFDPENPIHITAVYKMPEGTSLDDVAAAYSTQFALMTDIVQMPGLEIVPVENVQYGGVDWITFGMSMDMMAFAPDSVPMPHPQNFEWNAWMTVDDGLLYMEMAPEPTTVMSIIDGSYQGEFASDMPEMQAMSESSEIAFLLNLPGYLNMAMGLSGLEVPTVDSEPVWISMQLDIRQGGMNGSFSVSGTEMTAFIGSAIQTFGAMAGQ